jgi:signal transduction histidine kinase
LRFPAAGFRLSAPEGEPLPWYPSNFSGFRAADIPVYSRLAQIDACDDLQPLWKILGYTCFDRALFSGHVAFLMRSPWGIAEFRLGRRAVSRSEKTAGYYLLATVAAIGALLLREALGGEFGAHYPYHTVWLAVIFSAWYCGVGPSILAIAIDAGGIWYWFLPPFHSFAGKSHTEYMGIFGFLAFSGVIVALGESNRRLFLKRERAELELQKTNDELEQRVKQRTVELERSNESARRLSARVIAVQDEERRRIGRSLHDSLSQYLAAVKINLGQFHSQSHSDARLLSECSELVDQCLAETRTISHLLHPPLLDERGFCSATRSFVEGFSRRSGLVVTLELPEDPDIRFPRNLELALFRAVQEGLTNIHRYAEATAARISLTTDSSSVRLIISDNGKGVPASVLKKIRQGTLDAGVGIAGMRERLRELNGVIEIESQESGTTLSITAPATVLPSDQPSVVIGS